MSNSWLTRAFLDQREEEKQPRRVSDNHKPFLPDLQIESVPGRSHLPTRSPSPLQPQYIPWSPGSPQSQNALAASIHRSPSKANSTLSLQTSRTVGWSPSCWKCETPVLAAWARCPRCDADNVERVSEFGSTPCKAQFRCLSCLEPFEYFKCI